MHRYCGYCKQKEVLGDETHILLVCPTTRKLRDELIPQLERKLRLLDGPRWSSLTDNDRASVMLGNPPPSLLQKHINAWMEESMLLIHSYTTALLTLLRECKTPPDSPRPTTLHTNETNPLSSSSPSPPSHTDPSVTKNSRHAATPTSSPHIPAHTHRHPSLLIYIRIPNTILYVIYLHASSRIGISDSIGLIDPIFRGAGGVD